MTDLCIYISIVCPDVWHEDVCARLPLQAKKALSNKELLKEAVNLVKVAAQWKNIAQTLCADEKKKLAMKSHMGDLEVHLISIFLDRKKRQYETMGQAARECMAELVTETGATIPTLPDEWSDSPQDGSSKPTKDDRPKGPARLAQHKYAASGALENVEEVLASKGFQPGMQATRGDVTCTIRKITTSDVEILLDDQTIKLVSASSFLNGEWKLNSKTSKEQEEVEWTSDHPATSIEMQLQVLKAKTMVACWDQMQTAKCKDALNSLSVFKGPRSVTTSKTWAPKKMEIPCATNRVTTCEIGKEGQNELVIGAYKNFYVCLSPATKMGTSEGPSGCCNPFWMIPKSEEPDEVNVEACKDV